MAQIIKQRRVYYETEYRVEYTDRANPGCGFSFPANEEGQIRLIELAAPALANLRIAQADPERYTMALKTYTNKSVDDAQIKCDRCAQVVVLADAWWNVCPTCGADYDGTGNRLAPRSQWGEETGEVF